MWKETLGLVESSWCPEPDSNRHSAFAPRDFKSLVSTYSTIRAETGTTRIISSTKLLRGKCEGLSRERPSWIALRN